jgi:hypothetical protein
MHQMLKMTDRPHPLTEHRHHDLLANITNLQACEIWQKLALSCFALLSSPLRHTAWIPIKGMMLKHVALYVYHAAF